MTFIELKSWFDSLDKESQDDIRFAKWTFIRRGKWEDITADDCGEGFLRMWKYELEQRALGNKRETPPSDGLKNKGDGKFAVYIDENLSFAHLNDNGLTYSEVVARANKTKQGA